MSTRTSLYHNVLVLKENRSYYKGITILET